MNYSSSDPLVEAFIGYHIDNSTTIYLGKRQVFHNNLEMTQNEDVLRFTNTSLLGQNYTQSSEEFGLFVESSFGEKFVVEPKLALTSGDRKNSFGEDFGDSDLGGFKLGSRVNLYPLGTFSVGNEIAAVDLISEEKLKIQLGVALDKNGNPTTDPKKVPAISPVEELDETVQKLLWINTISPPLPAVAVAPTSVNVKD